MKPCILVAEDEASIRLMLRTALETEGYRVVEAADGKLALEAIHREKPDVMVLDLNMPVMDGMALLAEMKASIGVAGPRVIVLTAYGSIHAAMRAARLGAMDFLEKPVSPTELRNAVRGVMDEKIVPAEVLSAAAGGYEPALARVRRELRLEHVASAEEMLTQLADRRDKTSAAYFNLLGVLYESQHKWRLATKCYGKAIHADKNYEPAQLNLRRLYELNTFGRSEQAIVLGDESRMELLSNNIARHG